MKIVSQHRKTFLYLSLSLVSLLCAFLVSIPDNPPGIILSFISSILIILAFTHNWKKSRPFVFLLIGSVFCFVLFAILHNIFTVIGKDSFVAGIGTFFFLLAIFICPAGFIIGITGCISYALKEEKSKGFN